MAYYFDEEQKQSIQAWMQTFTARSEWPTWIVFVLVHLFWFLGLYAWRFVDNVFIAVVCCICLALVCAWHSSMQHEFIHQHPSRSPLLNSILGGLPISIWLPYRLYFESHLKHHDNPLLTLVDIDPESKYVSPERWENACTLKRWLFLSQKTLLGYFLLSPAMMIYGNLVQLYKQWQVRDWRYIPMWFIHIALCIGVLVFVKIFAGMSMLLYACIAYFGWAFALIRSFYEHRAVPDHNERSVLNEAGSFWRILFLHNNYHLVHHDLPFLPWYLVRKAYFARRDAFIERSGGYWINGYSSLMQAYATTMIDHPIHPLKNPSHAASLSNASIHLEP